jgi:D-aspartate ligase
LPSATGTVGAVVVGGDFQGLGIVRSLGRHGIPICVIDDERSISRFSRYTSRAIRVANLRDEQHTINTLLNVGHRFGLQGWVLYPTRDETVAALSRHRWRLSKWFRVPTPDWNTIQWVWDKRNTYRLAAELTIPVPRTWYLRNLGDVAAIDGDPPWAIKPAIKEHFLYTTGVKAWRADNRDELAERVRQAAALVETSEVMVQELIPGDGRQQFAYCAFFKNGQAIASMVVRRQRQHPPDFGRASTFVETIDLPEIEVLSQRFLQAINYYGLVELEYKFDLNDKQYKLLDVNARTWAYHTLGLQAGVNFPLMLFADQLGEPIEPCRTKADVRWIRLITDLPTALLEIRNGRLSWREYLRSLSSFQIESVFSRDDLLPALAELALVPYLAIKRGF